MKGKRLARRALKNAEGVVGDERRSSGVTGVQGSRNPQNGER
jgi:hypothetical protein